MKVANEERRREGGREKRRKEERDGRERTNKERVICWTKLWRWDVRDG